MPSRSMKKWICVGVFVALAIIGAIIAIAVSSSNSSKAKTSDERLRKHDNQTNSMDDQDEKTKERSLPDPITDKYVVSALAIGDWGRTIAKDGGSCCSRRKNYTATDYNAMEYTASLLGLAAKAIEPKPSVIIGHGDNFYWTGLQSKQDQAYRFQQTFEEKYQDAALANIPWINVMGNHDYGGASFICSNGDQPGECSSTKELLYHLKQKFYLQSSYKSPNGNRWIMKDHFYTYPIRQHNVTIDIFNLDTNDADTHGATQICCQCYGYSRGDDKNCRAITRGHQHCAGGDTDMYDACMKQLRKWGQESRDQLEAAVNASTATWKIVNTHYSPYNHFAPRGAERWKHVLEKLKLQLFLYGHTHGEKHDYATFKTHFIENGAGGGIQNESPSGIPPYAESYLSNIWSAGHYPYGIFALKLSAHWMQVQFMTFDKDWVVDKDLEASVVGGIDVQHCWYIPVYGGKGRPC